MIYHKLFVSLLEAVGELVKRFISFIKAGSEFVRRSIEICQNLHGNLSEVTDCSDISCWMGKWWGCLWILQNYSLLTKSHKIFFWQIVASLWKMVGLGGHTSSLKFFKLFQLIFSHNIILPCFFFNWTYFSNIVFFLTQCYIRPLFNLLCAIPFSFVTSYKCTWEP